MESIHGWGPAEHVVRRVLEEDRELTLSGEFFCGMSLESRIVMALRAEGLLNG